MEPTKTVPLIKLSLSLLTLLTWSCQFHVFGQEDAENQGSQEWTKVFEDNATGKWQDKWFVDGKKATVKYKDDGLMFKAGKRRLDNAHHAVLWTHQSFSGDIKVEYDFTRLDDSVNDVVIVYLLAEGVGDYPFPEDIYAWRKFRVIPYMHLYWWHMKALHISYAVNDGFNESYVRARQYPVRQGVTKWKETIVEPEKDFTGAGVFLKDRTYHITLTKIGNSLKMKVTGEGVEKEYDWDISDFEYRNNGRLGFRHMWKRSAKYQNIKVYQKE